VQEPEPEPVSSGNKLTAPSTIPVENFPADDCILEPVIDNNGATAELKRLRRYILDADPSYPIADPEMATEGISPVDAAISWIEKLKDEIDGGRLNDFLCALGEMPPGVTPSEAAMALIQKLQGRIVELQSSPAERAIPSLAKEAYELMVNRIANPDASFKSWDEMESFSRETYEGRAASLAVDGLFEQCVKEIQANA
jgi:hypothetical protein